MFIKQLSIFVENQFGRLEAIIDAIGKKGVNIRALSIAETGEFGILRLITNDDKTAEKTLKDAGYIIKAIDVVGVKIGDAPGKLTAALEVLDSNGINVDYLYAFMARTEKHAYVVLRVENNEVAEKVLTDAGFHLITEKDIDKL